MSVAFALRKIEAELRQLAKDAADHPADPFALSVIARKIGVQAEMVEEGCDG